jgi:DNA-binding CsgD family transcriptional regulator
LVTNEKEEAEGQAATPGRTRLSVLDARILEGVAAGISTVDMATKLYLSRQGVEYHVSSMLRRLRAPNRAALVSRAYSLGVLSVGSWPPKVLPDCVR